MTEERIINFKGLNRVQEEAVRFKDGPSLIIAGAGSGKTKVLTYKIAYLLSEGVPPSSILALTFTNKASKEMKVRISNLVGRDKAVRLWMGTFHSIFIRFLRDNAMLIGFPPSFTIYDQSDSRSAIRQCIKELELDEKIYKPADVLSRISFAKNSLITAQAYISNPTAVQNDMVSKKGRICDIYLLYSKKCLAAGVMDFDDILLYMNILLRDHPEVCERLKNEFKYILVDEYQDTNYAQYLIIRKLASGHRNITVVGDDSQSIYGFRGARIENILNFKRDYQEAREFRLEQNYRSTKTIVEAANSVIVHNTNRLKKECFSEGESGEKIDVIKAFTEQEEGSSVAASIRTRIYQDKASYDQFAILYRTNSQSRIIEEKLRKNNLPYKIYAGHSFYERAEVKDLLAYMRLVVNPHDDESFRRVVNVPARGIGDTSLGYLSKAAGQKGISLWETLQCNDLEEFGLKGAFLSKIRNFSLLISSFVEKIKSKDAYSLATEIASASGMISLYKNDNSIEAQAKFENIEELLSSVNDFVEDTIKSETEIGNEGAFVSLDSYLQNVALLSDIDSSEDNKDDTNKIQLMTVHAAKGLEFPYIYILGMEENLFPLANALNSVQEIEEERRLFYVALTRAMKVVTVSFCHSRFRFGQYVNYPPSRFLKEITPAFLSQPISDSLQTDRDEDDEDFSSRRSGFRWSKNYSAPIPREKVVIPRPTMSRPVQSVSPNFKADSPDTIVPGIRVEHDRFGKGFVKSVEGVMPNAKAVISFEIGGDKTLLLKYAKLRKI